MKKLLYLLPCIILMSSCLGDGDFNQPVSPVQGGILLHNATITQTAIVMDPFNVAFRLNTLLVECGGDLKNTTATSDKAKRELFANASDITSKIEDGYYIYTIRYNGLASSTSDLARNGLIVIKANTLYLSDPLARWEVQLDRNIPYVLYITKSANDAIKITPTYYQIVNNGDNSWKVQMYGITIEFNTTPGSGEVAEKLAWTGNYTITQKSGNQSLEGISKKNTIYSVAFNASGNPLTLPKNNISAETIPDFPLLYNTSCLWNSIVGNGEMKMHQTNDIMSIATTKFLGESAMECDPKKRITWDGKSEDFD